MNQCLMRLRHECRARLVYLDEPLDGEAKSLLELRDEAEGLEHDLGRREVDGLVRRGISRIPPLPEFAGELGISLAAAKSRLLRARHELKSRLEKHCGQLRPATLTA
jgi:RNA polymerase sigma-70 factor (ECF subfamily)